MSRERLYSQVVRDAAQLLGAQVRQARVGRAWTVRELAERAGVSKNTVVKVEHGDPTVALGIAFNLAVLAGVPLFFDDRARLASEASRAWDRVTLLQRRVRPSAEEPDYDF
jgi:transcriptional regulator with XRE-family HTH domain